MSIVFGVTASGLVVPVRVNTSGQIELSELIPQGQYGWYNGAWRKSPIPFGYSAALQDSVINTALAAGTNTMVGTTVPAGETWIVTNIVIRYTGAVATVNLLVFVDGGASSRIFNISPPVSNLFYDRQGFWPVPPAGQVRLQITNATLNDDAVLEYCGYKVELDQ